jgi:hypothetical protein
MTKVMIWGNSWEASVVTQLLLGILPRLRIPVNKQGKVATCEHRVLLNCELLTQDETSI